jgi:hypothetical protein
MLKFIKKHQCKTKGHMWEIESSKQFVKGATVTIRVCTRCGERIESIRK